MFDTRNSKSGISPTKNRRLIALSNLTYFNMKLTTQTIIESYLIRQRWQQENYPNHKLNDNGNKNKQS